MKDYSDDLKMFNEYIKEYTVDGRFSDGEESFISKRKPTKDSNRKLSYVDFLEEEDSLIERGMQMSYGDKGVVNVIDVDVTDETATVELEDETREFHVPFSVLQPL